MATAVTSLRIPTDLSERYNRLAKETGRSRSYYVNEALADSIDRFEYEYGILRDIEDYRAGRLETYSIDEVRAHWNGIVAENGKVVTDEMIADWESALERDEWPSGWVNVGEIVEGKLPKAAPETVTLSLKVPAAMKRALEKEAKAEGKSTGAYARGILADGLMAIA